jgi:hypothetical protein
MVVVDVVVDVGVGDYSWDVDARSWRRGAYAGRILGFVLGGMIAAGCSGRWMWSR